MKQLFVTIAALAFAALPGFAQGNAQAEGIPYFLPKTGIRLAVMVEKTTYTPGELAMYGEKYMKLFNTSMEKSTEYRVVGINITDFGTPDSTKHYVAAMDKKHSISDVKLADNGLLLAINTTPPEPKQPKNFVPARPKRQLNPKDFMNQEILSAGSSAKMAELIAKEIYDIRDSRNQLSRGQADAMPKDGEQLRLMLNNLDLQERALLQVFAGTTVKDTTETIINFVPMKPVEREILFRFSRHYGMADKDDLGGIPYYISVEDLHSIPAMQASIDRGKVKDNAGVYVNLPGKVKVSVAQENNMRAVIELYMAQFGKTEPLSGELFGKKQLTQIVFSPVTGAIESVKTESVK